MYTEVYVAETEESEDRDLVVVTLRVPPKDRDRLEEFADQRGVSKSEAARDLLRGALDRREEEEDPEASNLTLQGFLVVMGAVLTSPVYVEVTPTGELAGPGLIVMGVALGLWRRYTYSPDEPTPPED